MKLFQYQMKAEPLTNLGEISTPWSPTYPDKIARRVGLAVCLLAACSFVEAAQGVPALSGISSTDVTIHSKYRLQYQATAEIPSEAWSAAPADDTDHNPDKWDSPTNQPVFRAPRIVSPGWSGAQVFITIQPTPVLDSWYLPISQPVFKRKSFLQEGWSICVAIEAPHLYQWNQATDSPTPRAPRPFWQGRYTVDPMELMAILPDPEMQMHWYERSPIHRHIYRFRQYLYPDFANESWVDLIPVESITLDKWWSNIVQPTYRKPRTQEGWSDPEWLYPSVVPTISLDEWLPQFSDIVWDRNRLWKYLHRSVLTDDWIADLFHYFIAYPGEAFITNACVNTATMNIASVTRVSIVITLNENPTISEWPTQ